MKQFSRFACTLGLFLLCFTKTRAQYCDANMLGVRTGVSFTSIHNLTNMIVDADYYSGYSFNDKAKLSPTASLFYSYHKGGDLFGLSIASEYYQMRTNSEYEDINGLEYTIGYQFHYVGLEAMLKVYPYKGTYFGPVVRAGICLSPNNIYYRSNQEAEFLSDFKYSSVQTTYQCLVEKLTGRPEAAVGLSAGYEFENGFSIHGTYLYSVTDLVETSVNAYGWTEHINRANNFQVVIGYAIGIDGK